MVLLLVFGAGADFFLPCSMMNTGSPYNLAAGSRVDLSHVVAHYERKNQEIDEARVVRMKDGKSLYD